MTTAGHAERFCAYIVARSGINNLCKSSINFGKVRKLSVFLWIEIIT